MKKNHIILLALSFVILALICTLYYKLNKTENYLVGINNPLLISQEMAQLPACVNRQIKSNCTVSGKDNKVTCASIGASVQCAQLLSSYENKLQHPLFNDGNFDTNVTNDNLLMSYCCCDPTVKPLEPLPQELQQKVDALRSCPVDCVVSEYSWGSCDPVSGQQQGTRRIVTDPKNGGAQCPDLTSSKNCPVDCVASELAWGACDPASGTSMGTRNIVTPPLNGGAPCPPVQMSQPCPVDCAVSDWNQGACDPSTNMRTDMRTVIVPGQNGGASCPELTQTTPCQPDTTPPSSNLRLRRW